MRSKLKNGTTAANAFKTTFRSSGRVFLSVTFGSVGRQTHPASQLEADAR